MEYNKVIWKKNKFSWKSKVKDGWLIRADQDETETINQKHKETTYNSSGQKNRPTHTLNELLSTNPEVPPHRRIWLFSYATVWVYSFKIELITQRDSWTYKTHIQNP